MNIVVLSGAGISAESGIKTFRDRDHGIWTKYDVDKLGTVEAWKDKKNRPEMFEFFKSIKEDMENKHPNDAHKIICDWEDKHNVTVITQNIDNLHELAGSSRVLHLHGEINKVRSTLDDAIYDAPEEPIGVGDKCPKGSQLRPHLVLFGEYPYNIEEAVMALQQADAFVAVGCSFEVSYVINLLSTYLPEVCKVYYVDKEPVPHFLHTFPNAQILKKLASEGVRVIKF